jgi:pimeloyl-ACP methyl ester carboxylesterase
MSPNRPSTAPLHYRISGSGPPLLLLHGLGSSAEDWELQVPVFSRFFRVVAVDLPGHGRSAAGPGRLTVEGMAGAVAGLLGELGVGPADVLGLSLGGCVAQALAARHPARVRRLVLVNTFARLQPAGRRGALRMAQRLGLLLAAPMPTVAAHVARGLFPRPEQRGFYEQCVARLGRNRRRAYLAAVLAIARFDARPWLPGLRCPALVVVGDRDQTVPRAAALALYRALPRAELALIEDSGHATPIDHAEVFNEVVVGWLGEEILTTKTRRHE